MNSIKKQARVAGLLYLLASLSAPFALIYVPSTLIVPGDATGDGVLMTPTLANGKICYVEMPASDVQRSVPWPVTSDFCPLTSDWACLSDGE